MKAFAFQPGDHVLIDGRRHLIVTAPPGGLLTLMDQQTNLATDMAREHLDELYGEYRLEYDPPAILTPAGTVVVAKRSESLRDMSRTD